MLKSKLYKTVVRPAMVYGSECRALRKQEEQRLHTTEMKVESRNHQERHN